jgi:hypothetical protein
MNDTCQPLGRKADATQSAGKFSDIASDAAHCILGFHQCDFHRSADFYSLAPGDILLGYTDGVTEATAADGRFFTTDQLVSILKTPSSTAVELLDRIAAGLQAHMGTGDQFDDITLLAIRRIPSDRGF